MASQQFQRDVLQTSAGSLEMTFLGHGTLMFSLGGTIIHVDPYGRVADYAALPQGDLVLITHEHGDHLDPEALAAVRGEDTTVVLTRACAEQVKGGVVMRNGDTKTLAGIEIEAVPAYNIAHKRPNGQPFHPKGRGNGYVLTFGDTRVYVAGDTEDIPEMAALEDINCAFLPMNLPYTMSPDMVAKAARSFGPRIVYPYHYGSTDPQQLVDLLAEDEIEVRVRDLA
jgi:L-ascorbate metabolism protein UlaG (beta-lactamase superfamily)